jgi:hypothetical protein
VCWIGEDPGSLLLGSDKGDDLLNVAAVESLYWGHWAELPMVRGYAELHGALE